MKVGDIYQRRSGPLVEIQGVDEMFVAFNYGGEQTYFLGHDDFERRFTTTAALTAIDGHDDALLDPAVADAGGAIRRGDWMQTYRGRQFWPLDPRAEDVEIVDIAHSLSMQCRYAGHCRRFYSVAEHCVHLSFHVPEEHAVWALLHDASEAYLVDVPRPVKPFLAGYRQAEDAVMAAVAQRFGLDGEMPAIVKEADNRIVADEREQNMIAPPKPWALTDAPLGVRLAFWSPFEAREQFLDRWEELTGDFGRLKGDTA